MKKIRTLSMLQDFLDAEFSWRLKEVADLKLATRSTRARISPDTLIRASIPLLYAHWEGFIKNSSIGYVNFVNHQKMKYEELDSCFIVFGMKKKLIELAESKVATSNIAMINFLISDLGNTTKLQLNQVVDTESNLSSKVFENVAVSIGIDPGKYKPKYALIDKSLLERRNGIAHGEYIDIDSKDWRVLADEVLGLMRGYKNDIENAATEQSYIRTNTI